MPTLSNTIQITRRKGAMVGPRDYFTSRFSATLAQLGTGKVGVELPHSKSSRRPKSARFRKRPLQRAKSVKRHALSRWRLRKVFILVLNCCYLNYFHFFCVIHVVEVRDGFGRTEAQNIPG